MDLDYLYQLGDAAFEAVDTIRAQLKNKEHALGEDDICMMVGELIQKKLDK